MTAISSRELTRLRLAAQLVHPRAHGDTDATAVVRSLLAVQAQDFGGALWSLALRTGARSEPILSALERRSVVRSWPHRGTLHLVAAEDLAWMLRISRRRQGTTGVRRRAQLGIEDAHLVTAATVAVSLLEGGRTTSRDDLVSAWSTAGLDIGGQRAYHLLWHLSHEGLLVFATPEVSDGGVTRHSIALFDEWIGYSRDLDGDEALAEYALRYFLGHGPATVRDLAWWASLSLGEARRGLAIVAGQLEQSDDYWFAPNLTPAPAAAVLALPGFDEFLLGYQDRSAALPASLAPHIVPGNNGVFQPTIVVDGAVVGTWRRLGSGRNAAVEARTEHPLSATRRRGFEKAIGRWALFTGIPVSVRYGDTLNA